MPKGHVFSSKAQAGFIAARAAEGTPWASKMLHESKGQKRKNLPKHVKGGRAVKAHFRSGRPVRAHSRSRG